VPLANSFTLASLIGVLLIIKISGITGKKETMLSGIVTAFVGQLILTAGVYLHTLPVLFTGIFINSIGHGIIVGLVSIMIADTIRYGTTMGIQAEGILASTDNLGVNMGLGIGGMITAGLFQLSGYVSNHAQNTATLHMINVNYVWIPLAIYVVMFIVLTFYNETKINTAIN
jgi:Na+/melibiose symporter-like transporter